VYASRNHRSKSDMSTTHHGFEHPLERLSLKGELLPVRKHSVSAAESVFRPRG